MNWVSYILITILGIVGIYLFFRISSFAVLKSYFQLKEEESKNGKNTKSEKKGNAGGTKS